MSSLNHPLRVQQVFAQLPRSPASKPSEVCRLPRVECVRYWNPLVDVHAQQQIHAAALPDLAGSASSEALRCLQLCAERHSAGILAGQPICLLRSPRSSMCIWQLRAGLVAVSRCCTQQHCPQTGKANSGGQQAALVSRYRPSTSSWT